MCVMRMLRVRDTAEPINFSLSTTISLSSLNLIGQNLFELESGNENVDRQTNGWLHATHLKMHLF